MRKVNTKKTNPRATALDILNRYFEKGCSLKELISESLERSDHSSLDRRFIFNIAKGTVRHVLRFDFIISNISNRKTSEIDPGILNILRMGVYQFHFMDRVPAYSIVDESVKLAKDIKGAAGGFVNAVMRRISEINDPDSYLKAMLRRQRAGDTKVLSVMHSFPEWIIKYWTEYFGKEKTIRICTRLNQIPGFYIRINTGGYLEQTEDMADPARILKGLKNIKAKPIAIDIDDVSRLDGDFRRVFEAAALKHLKKGQPVFGEAGSLASAIGIDKEKLYKDGIISVQDLSSQMAVKYFLEPRPQEKILDCCAAPGGKALFASDLMKNSGHILAVDKSPGKIKILSENIKRSGTKNISTFLADSSITGFLDRAEGDYLNYFDAVMVDGPCSALGTAAKNPEVKYRRDPDDIDRLSDLTIEMISACDPYLKKGGRMLFYTCTISPVENGRAIRRFLGSTGDRYEIAENIDTAGNAVKMEMEIMPYYLQSEGGYLCVLIKKN